MYVAKYMLCKDSSIDSEDSSLLNSKDSSLDNKDSVLDSKGPAEFSDSG